METKETKIPHLRLCVTKECPYNCLYCRPGGEACRYAGCKDMSLRQIHMLVQILADYGITHLKITGGEPLVRDDIPEMIRSLLSIKGIQDIQLVSRSPRIGVLAGQLKEAGLTSLNVSLDSLNPYTLLKITRNGRLDLLLKAIRMAYQAVLSLKFNMVVMRGINDGEIHDMIEFVAQYKGTLKLLDLMNMPGEPKFLGNYYMPFESVNEFLSREAAEKSVETPPGGVGTPMPKYIMPNGAIVLVKDARVGTWYSDVCVGCKNFPCQDAIMALRLTSDGCLQRCLLRNDNLIDLLSMVEKLEKSNVVKASINTVLRTYHGAVYHEKAWEP